MSNRVESITIVGGGSAGWLAASILSAALNRRNDGPDVDITLIESPSIPTVGVGEATTFSMEVTLDQLKIDEKDFIKRCDGSFKGAVRFVDWNVDGNGDGTTFYHPFEAPGYLHGYHIAYYYNKYAKRGGQPSFIHSVVPSLAMIEQLKAPRALDSRDYRGFIPYAYHMDAKLLADFLTDYATSLGVTHIVDDVDEVRLDERGFVSSLKLREHGEHPIEFVIDCTGFRSLIIKEALGEPFIPYGDWLLCDRALALRIPHPEEGKIAPFTTSQALGAGWAWNVPLYTRLGTGYVFSSQFRTDDEAIDEFLAHLGLSEKDAEPKVVPMRIGRSRRSWVKNCLALGLAGGFIEPLESTSLHFTQMAIRWFVDHFPDKEVSPALSGAYNRLMSNLYEEIRDFITMHYYTSNRTDTAFWKAAREDVKVPDTLIEKLELWKHKMPGIMDTNEPYSMFENWNYICILAGKGYFDGRTYPLEGAISDQDYLDYRKLVMTIRNDLLKRAPDHYELLTRIRNEDYATWYNPDVSFVTGAEFAPEAKAAASSAIA